MIWLLACTGDEPAVDETGLADPLEFPVTIGTDRPTEVLGPDDWRGVAEIPVVVMLHGYAANAEAQDLVFKLSFVMQEKRFLLVMAQGTKDPDHVQFWNATDACCNFYDSDVDDVGYLMGLVDELEATYPIGPVYFVGHSNGAYMSYRMACEHPDRIAAIAPLAGMTWKDEDRCTVGDPVPVLHHHGTDDDRVYYDGGPDYPGAVETAERWAGRAGCTGTADGGTLDLIPSIDGAETDVLDWTGCETGGVTLWTHNEAGHVPFFDQGYAATLVDWLYRWQ